MSRPSRMHEPAVVVDVSHRLGVLGLVASCEFARRRSRPTGVVEHISFIDDGLLFNAPPRRLAPVCSPSLSTCTPLTKTCAHARRRTGAASRRWRGPGSSPGRRRRRRRTSPARAARAGRGRGCRPAAPSAGGCASSSGITCSSRTYLPSRRAKLPYARGCAVRPRGTTPSGAIDAGVGAEAHPRQARSAARTLSSDIRK